MKTSLSNRGRIAGSFCVHYHNCCQRSCWPYCLSSDILFIQVIVCCFRPYPGSEVVASLSNSDVGLCLTHTDATWLSWLSLYLLCRIALKHRRWRIAWSLRESPNQEFWNSLISLDNWICSIKCWLHNTDFWVNWQVLSDCSGCFACVLRSRGNTS